MKTGAALLCYTVAFLAAFHWAHSASGLLVIGLGPTLLLDRYAFRLLPWPVVAWKREAGVRAVSFLGGAVAFFLLRPGVVPVGEAACWGLVVCLAAFLLEWAGRTRLVWGGVLVALLLPLVVGLHPLHTVPKRTPAAFGMPFEDVHFRTADGLELAGWLVPHPRPRGNLLFCHGHGRNRGHVAGLLETFHHLGLNVLAFDFRGHGESPGHTATFGDREVQDVVAAAAYLHQRFPDQPLFVVGVSYGAAVALQALPQLPGVAGVWSEGSFARMDHLVANQFRLAPAGLREGLVAVYEVLGWLDCGVHGQDINPVEALKGLRVPIYFCHAREDRLVPFAEGQALYDAYGGPKDCWWVADATHFNVRQRHPQEYARRLRAFFEGRLTACCPGDGGPAGR